jgi:ABC-type amino acid transport substrate-binding protein
MIFPMLRAFLCLCLLALPPALGQGPTATAPALSEQQLGWAAGRTIRVGSDPDFAPFSHREPDGSLQGVDSKLLEAIAGQTGLKFQSIAYASWTEAWEALVRGEVDMVTGCAETPERREKVLFTAPYARPRLAIIARHDTGHGWSVEDLAGLTLAIPRSYAQLEDVLSRVPDVQLPTCSTLPEALRMVAAGQADATVMSLASAVSLLPQTGSKELRVTGFYDRDFPLRLAVRRDLPELATVLDAALSALRHQSAGAAYADWVDERLDEWAEQGRQLRRQQSWVRGLAAAMAALAAAAGLGWWRAGRRSPKPAGTENPSLAATGADRLLESAFDRTIAPMLVVQTPDLIVHRNASARTLIGGAMVLPPELSDLVARLAALPPETPEDLEWGPPGHPPTRWQAHLLPLTPSSSLLTLSP